MPSSPEQPSFAERERSRKGGSKNNENAIAAIVLALAPHAPVWAAAPTAPNKGTPQGVCDPAQLEKRLRAGDEKAAKDLFECAKSAPQPSASTKDKTPPTPKAPPVCYVMNGVSPTTGAKITLSLTSDGMLSHQISTFGANVEAANVTSSEVQFNGKTYKDTSPSRMDVIRYTVAPSTSLSASGNSDNYKTSWSFVLQGPYQVNSATLPARLPDASQWTTGNLITFNNAGKPEERFTIKTIGQCADTAASCLADPVLKAYYGSKVGFPGSGIACPQNVKLVCVAETPPADSPDTNNLDFGGVNYYKASKWMRYNCNYAGGGVCSSIAPGVGEDGHGVITKPRIYNGQPGTIPVEALPFIVDPKNPTGDPTGKIDKSFLDALKAGYQCFKNDTPVR